MKGEAEKVRVCIELPPCTIAPVISGQRVGKVRYLLEGRELCALPLAAAYAVDALSLIHISILNSAQLPTRCSGERATQE